MAHAFAVLAALALPVGVVATGICPRLQEPATALGLSHVPLSVSVSFDLAVAPNELVDNSTYDNVRYEVKKGDAVLSDGQVDLAGLVGSLNLNIFQTSFQVSIPGLSTGMQDLTLSMVGLPEECFTSDRTREEVAFQVKVLPRFLGVLPPMTTIVLAIATRNGVVSLAGGVWMGATLINGYNPITGWLRMLDKYLVNSMADSSNASIILISLFITGMVAVISKSGGAQGIANFVIEYAGDSKKGQIAAWCTGCFLFFDDYANILVNGNAFRPIADKLRISRAKLAFIIDCSAAAFASIAPFSTWISFEIGLIQDELANIQRTAEANGTEYISTSAYILLLSSRPYSFYQMMILVFSLMVAVSNRDIGPMVAVETAVRAGQPESAENTEEADRERKALEAKPDVPKLAMNGFIPILSVVVTLLLGLLWTGYNGAVSNGDPINLATIVGNADSYSVLIWSSMMGLVVPMIALKYQSIMEPTDTLQVWFLGMKTMIEPLFVLLGAWSLGAVVKELQLPEFVIQILGPAVPLGLVPTLVFLIACVIAFSTGTSFGTMAVLFPLVVPLMWSKSGPPPAGDGLPLAEREQWVIQGVGAILAGAIFGDHCSPISDTTILSALSTGCKATEHVRTQLPYAAIAAFVAIFLGYLPTGLLGVNVFLCLLAGWAALYGILMVLGQPMPIFVEGDGQAATSKVELGEALTSSFQGRGKVDSSAL